MASVSLIDYGVGNIRAFANVFHRLDVSVEIARSTGDIGRAQRLVLPGVGSFDWAMQRLNASGLRDALDEAVLSRFVPVLGVCVGMQMMGKRSDEGDEAGLGWIDAGVRHFSSLQANSILPYPHMGWNDVMPTPGGAALFSDLEAPRFYSLHSYCVVPADPVDIAASASYGTQFAAALRRENIVATQFHPEKSHRWGVGLLRNFAAL